MGLAFQAPSQLPRALGREQPPPGTRLRSAPLLALRHRQQGQVGGPTGQGLGHLAHEQQIRGAREQKGALAALPVHGPLDGEEQVGRALDLVQRQAVPLVQQDVGSVPGPRLEIQIVQGQIAARARRGEVLDQGALPRLPGPREDHDRELPERLLDDRRQEAGEEGDVRSIHDVHDSHSRRELQGPDRRESLVSAGHPSGHPPRLGPRFSGLVGASRHS